MFKHLGVKKTLLIVPTSSSVAMLFGARGAYRNGFLENNNYLMKRVLLDAIIKNRKKCPNPLVN
jgi:hypothetical protein